MKKLLFFAVLISIFLLPSSVFSGPVERTLSLEESITTAMQISQEIMIAQEQVYIAEQRVKESKALIYPKIDLNFSASQFQSDFPTVLAPTFGSLYLPPGSNDNYYSTRFSLWQYLYAGGRYSTNLELAEKNLSQAQAQAEVIRNKRIREVRKAFYSLLVAKEKIGIYENIKGSAQEKARAELARAKYEYEKKKLYFLEIMGLELTTLIDVQGALKAPEGEYDLNKCLAWAIQHRPELRQTQFQEAINTLQVNLTQIERKATISLGANYEWAGGAFPLEERNWNATINMNFPIFDGWASLARTRQRRHQEEESKIRRADIQDQVNLDVRQALLDYNFWKSRESIQNSKRAESLESEKKLDAELQWIDSAQQLLSSHADLEWSIGGPLK
ncbi:MAG: TolC family protein [Elusimicrobiota bacterium]